MNFSKLGVTKTESQTAQAQYESLIINTCGLRNPQNGREHKGQVT